MKHRQNMFNMYNVLNVYLDWQISKFQIFKFFLAVIKFIKLICQPMNLTSTKKNNANPLGSFRFYNIRLSC
jgi:hypothetical protein